MHSLKAPVTVIVFWDINCGHCKKEIPELGHLYDSAIRDMGVEIYAVYTQGDWEGWKKFIKKNDLKFINVANQFGQSNFRKTYNILSTPAIYILDENKNIRFKKVGVENIIPISKFLIEEQQKNREN